MHYVSETIKTYLSMDTSYAMMITGPYGVGKTYFFKNDAVPLIADSPTIDDESRKYKPVLVSLFGHRSIDDIQAAILAALYPILGNKWAKLSFGVVSGLFKGFLKLKGLDQFNQVAKDVKGKKEDLISFKDLVLVFDDIERRHTDLALEEFLGFINSLVEHEENKIILIANEDKLQGENYRDLREKTIGIIIPFRTEQATLMRVIIEKDYSHHHVYHNFLLEIFQTISERFAPNSNNLRVFSYWLAHFQRVYSRLILALEGMNVLKQQPDLMDGLIRFSVAVAIEYRAGHLEYGDRKGIDRQNHMTLQALFAEQVTKQGQKAPKDKAKEYYEEFQEKYYKDQRYYFYDSVFDFFTGGGDFDAASLINELKRQYHIVDNEIPPHYVGFSLLHYPAVYSLNDGDYLTYTRQLLKDVEAGKFNLSEYITVFHYIYRFGNPLRISLPRLKDRIISGMKRGRSAYSHVPVLERQIMVSVTSDHHLYLDEIAQACLKMNETLQESAHNDRIKTLNEQFLENDPMFYNSLREKNNDLIGTPVFDRFSPQATLNHLLKQENQRLVQFIDLLRFRLENGSVYHLRPEKAFFNPFSENLERKVNSLKKRGGLRWFILTDLQAAVNAYLVAL